MRWQHVLDESPQMPTTKLGTARRQVKLCAVRVRGMLVAAQLKLGPAQQARTAPFYSVSAKRPVFDMMD